MKYLWSKEKNEANDHIFRPSDIQFAIGYLGNLYGETKIAKAFGTSRQNVYYYVRKFRDENFHPVSWGGSRYFIWGRNLLSRICGVLFSRWNSNPTYSLKEYIGFVRDDVNVSISRSSIGWIFQKVFNFSWKIATVFSFRKYTRDNIEKYKKYVDLIQRIPVKKIHYLDEVTFVPKKVDRRKALGPVGQPVRIISTSSISESSRYNMTLICNSEKIPFIEIRETTNSQFDFSSFVKRAVDIGYLAQGDVLVIDNAPVHLASDTEDDLLSYLHDHGVFLLRLPKYSPELNPCELIFQTIKKRLRKEQIRGVSLRLQIIFFLSQISRVKMLRFIYHCLKINKMQ